MGAPKRIRIREADPSDRDGIVAFNVALALESEGKRLDPETVRRGVHTALTEHREHARYFLAEIDGDLVGQTLVTPEWSDWRAGWFWWIQSVFVREDRRKFGVFRALYAHIEAAAKARADVIGLRLYVDRENRGAREVYARLGMSPTAYDLYEIEWPRPGAATGTARAT